MRTEPTASNREHAIILFKTPDGYSLDQPMAPVEPKQPIIPKDRKTVENIVETESDREPPNQEEQEIVKEL